MFLTCRVRLIWHDTTNYMTNQILEALNLFIVFYVLCCCNDFKFNDYFESIFSNYLVSQGDLEQGSGINKIALEPTSSKLQRLFVAIKNGVHIYRLSDGQCVTQMLDLHKRDIIDLLFYQTSQVILPYNFFVPNRSFFGMAGDSGHSFPFLRRTIFFQSKVSLIFCSYFVSLVLLLL